MITLKYDPNNGIAYRDGGLDEYVNRLCIQNNRASDTNNEIHITAATENIFLALRVAIKQGRISHEDVLVEYNKQFGKYDKDGRSEFWPDGFCDYHQKQLLELL